MHDLNKFEFILRYTNKTKSQGIEKYNFIFMFQNQRQIAKDRHTIARSINQSSAISTSNQTQP